MLRLRSCFALVLLQTLCEILRVTVRQRPWVALLRRTNALLLLARGAKMGESNVISNFTGNVIGNLVHAMGETTPCNGEEPEGFSDGHKKAGFILSMQRLDILAAM